MMVWEVDAFILCVRPFNERDVMLDVLTRTHGKMRIIVKFGATKKNRSLYQEGNFIACTIKARDEEALGSASCEMIRGYLASLLNKPLHLMMLQTAHALCLSFLYEREPATDVYDALEALYHHLCNEEIAHACAALCSFEIMFLASCGYALDLQHCVATGDQTNLMYVSPKSGCAVSAKAGEPYKDRLFRLPTFLHDPFHEPTQAELLDALTMNAYFLTQRLCDGDASRLPVVRKRLHDKLQRMHLPLYSETELLKKDII